MLGHIHKHQCWDDGGRLIAYAGSIGRFHHGEIDAKGFLLWEVEAAAARLQLVETPARRTVDLVFDGAPDAEQIAAAVREVNVAGAYVRVRWQMGEEERGSVDRDAIKRALGDAADVQLEGRVVPVVRSRAAGISRASSLQEKVRVWARATGSMDGPLIERLEALAHREPAQIANAILASDEEAGPTTEPAPDETAPPLPSGDGRVAEALREAEAMELF
jgi:exonuclease SbcD